MAGQKRRIDDPSTTPKAKKTKISTELNHKIKQSVQPTSSLRVEELDFPRGGGTSFTPLEVKTIRAEAVKEADKELFEDTQANARISKKRKRKSDLPFTIGGATKEKSDKIRIEHLNYKRLTIGMKILGQIISIQPLALIISLPNQLYGHVPITQISSQFTNLLEAMDEDEEAVELDEASDEEPVSRSRVPDLIEIFHPGQYVRTMVTTVHASGASDMSAIGKTRDEVVRASRRVELTLVPERVNAGVQKFDLKSGFTFSAAVKSVEDHGYILDLGVPDVSGFLSFKDAKKGPFNQDTKLHVGRLIHVSVTNLSANGRTCNVVVDPATLSSSSLSEVTNVASILPGTLVQSLITAVHPNGLNLQILGYFDGTVDQLHLRHDASEKSYKVGKKIKARILYDISSTPPKFSLSLAEHILGFGPRRIKGQDKQSDLHTIQEAYPIGTVLDAVKVKRVETERGLIVEIESGLEGFIHISHVSDDHVPSLSSSSGSWKVGSLHRARVTGCFAFDGILQLSLKPSVIEQKFLQVVDVQVGELVKGTIKKLTDSGLFVSLSGNVDGVVRANHYADITLKHPSKRFKPGASIKCRVLSVDPERKRIALTAKKTLLDSTLPILSQFEDCQVGLVTHAVISKVNGKNLMVDFYNNLKAIVPAREISETLVNRLGDSFPIGKVVRVRIISLESEHSRVVASIRQAASNFKSSITDISGVEIGNIVEGVISEIHTDNAVLILQPTEVRALISLKNMSNHRNIPLVQLRAALKVGEKLEELVVVSRNPEKGFVIVANKPKVKAAMPPKGSTLSLDSITIGQIVGGRVTRHTRNGALVKLGSHIGGILHPTDISDNYESGSPYPAIDTLLKATVVAVDLVKKQLTLSTRHSKMNPDAAQSVVDREISDVEDLKEGETVRGFIKSVAEHGLFVTVGRNIDARVQIRELFDDYVKEWKSKFQVNQLVKGRVLRIEVAKKQVEMSFRTSDVRNADSPLTFGDIRQGQKVEGRVKRIEDYGLFIQIEGSKLSGLCHKSELTDTTDADVNSALHNFRESDRVKAIILSIEKHRISFSLKPSHFVEEDYERPAGDEYDAENSESLGVIDDVDVIPENNAFDEDDEDPILFNGIEDENAMQIDQTSPSHVNQQPAVSKTSNSSTAKATIAAPLKIHGGFQWNGTDIHLEEPDSSSPSDDSDNEADLSTKKKKRQRKEIEQDLTAEMHTKTPESNSDFERLLLGSPNSSYLWIQYMSFQLQLSEVEKAREIARRALQTINFREEQEKLNVWIALLNLENAYGTEETLEATFRDAARHNESKAVHLRLAVIFDQSEKHQKAEEQYKRTCKKFGQSSKVWTLFGEYYLQRGQIEESRKLLPRSLQSLDKRKHLKTISKFAQLEYKLGDPERGKTLFEGIVESHPKRWDLWSVYMDMEAGQENIQSLRNLFDRVLALKMTSHKAKSFFKKWLELERKMGDKEGATIVKQKALEWTQRASNL